jgi:hypothetical protein
MGVVLGQQKMIGTCGKTMHMGTMDRGFTVPVFSVCMCIPLTALSPLSSFLSSKYLTFKLLSMKVLATVS